MRASGRQKAAQPKQDSKTQKDLLDNRGDQTGGPHSGKQAHGQCRGQAVHGTEGAGQDARAIKPGRWPDRGVFGGEFRRLGCRGALHDET